MGDWFDERGRFLQVRELQRVTGAQVKIPEDAAEGETEETIVRVVGNFQASQVRSRAPSFPSLSASFTPTECIVYFYRTKYRHV